MRQAKVFFTILFLLAVVFAGQSQITNIPAPRLKMSSESPLILIWPTNDWRFSIETTTNADLKSGWSWLRVPRTAIGTNFFVTNTLTDSSRFFRLACYPQQMCRYQLAQIGLEFRIWAGDNYNIYPFHVSTNRGGTIELRAIGPDGFDTNAYRHFQVLSEYLTSPALLVCPSDIQRNPAQDFPSLKPENITYQLRTGDLVIDDNPDEIMMVCPIDGNVVRADGTVPNYP